MAVSANLRDAEKIRGQRGGARLRLMVWLVILGSFVFVCFKVIPPYYTNYVFQDWMRTSIEDFLIQHQMSNDGLKNTIFKEIQSEGVPASKDDIHILQNDARGVNVEVDYDVTVNLLVYDLRLHFTPSHNSQSLVQ